MSRNVPASSSIGGLEAFFERYRTFGSRSNLSRLESFATAFRRLSQGLEAIEEARREDARVRASRFNIFSVLGVHRREVTTHSAFLAHLLDPQGDHGQGHLFLRMFLELCGNRRDGTEAFKDRSLIDQRHWMVTTEKATARGNLDIVVQSSTTKVLIVIENKIDAAEGVDQIQRYSHWLEGQHLYPEDRRRLYYLTLDGKDALSHGGRSYCTLSYRPELREWLLRSKQEIVAARLREVIDQYVDIIDAL